MVTIHFFTKKKILKIAVQMGESHDIAARYFVFKAIKGTQYVEVDTSSNLSLNFNIYCKGAFGLL